MATSRLERIGTIFTRKQTNESLIKSLTEVITHLEADYNALKDNEQKMEHLTGAFIKCIQQATNAHKQKIKALKEIHASFQKEVEGLLKRGGMKADDRPLWFDIYRAFPPITEPKFAKPKPENIKIRPILYKEDLLRAKLHTNGLGLGPVNLLSTTDSQTKKCIKQYEKLKSEGIPESELIEKVASSVAEERQITKESSRNIGKTPGSVTSQILGEADIKNIFKE